MGRRLSLAASAPQAAAWLAGFLAGDAVLLVHDATLLGLVDTWVSGLDEVEFEDLLPLVRRTFAEFSAAERRTIGEQLSRLGRPGTAAAPVDSGIDLEQARPAVQAVARFVGWKVVARDGAA
jgi:hypothetical protein